MIEVVNVVVVHANVSKCAFCKNTGHTIRKCTSTAIQKLADELVGVANYCIAFHPNPTLLEGFVDSITGTQLNVLRRKIGLKCRDDKTAIIQKLYTNKVGLDDSRIVAKTALEQTGGHQSRAARLLGLNATTLNSKIKTYNISLRF